MHKTDTAYTVGCMALLCAAQLNVAAHSELSFIFNNTIDCSKSVVGRTEYTAIKSMVTDDLRCCRI